MFDNLSMDDIAHALDELLPCFGVKQDMPFRDFTRLVSHRTAEECAQEVARGLDLPVAVRLVYTTGPRQEPATGPGFETTALAPRDPSGRRVAGIRAQVEIPLDLPPFGSRRLQGFPIQVRVTGNCYDRPKAFVAIIAHELSHVLLASLRSPHKNSELHTDLIPVLLGFRHTLQEGRKVVEVKRSGNTTLTTTTTSGYLTDEQFDFACSYALGVLGQLRSEEVRLQKAEHYQE